MITKNLFNKCLCIYYLKYVYTVVSVMVVFFLILGLIKNNWSFSSKDQSPFKMSNVRSQINKSLKNFT